MARVLALFTADTSRGPVTSPTAVQLRAGCGIVGDRHYKRNAPAAEQITLIESEAIDAYNREYRQQVAAATLRRNVLTEGVDLNALEGREFLLGAIRLRGIELCEPCSVVGKLLAGDLTPSRVIQALLGRGGLRCEILSTGVVRVGDAIQVAAP
ncbi:MAG: MOSC domain-containing protein [Alcanivorax sp.]|nr:MOSC domain-containing protein [Alcanivorax sp.]